MPDVRVTDHAIVRYLERARGVDVEGIRSHIAAMCKSAAAAGATAVRAEGVSFVIERSGVVVTVAPDSPTPSATGRRRAAERRGAMG